MHSPLRIETSRLRLRWLEPGDAGFIYRLVNDAQWLRFIGDRQVSSLQDAQAYIENGPRRMYREAGFGLNRLALRAGDTPIGVCGLLRREWLPHCDLGFALLPAYRGQGYAYEAASAILRHGFGELDQPCIAAIVSADNRASVDLLTRLGFVRERTIDTAASHAALDLYLVRRAT